MTNVTAVPGSVTWGTEARAWGAGPASLRRALGSIPSSGRLLSAQTRTRVGSGSQTRAATRPRAQGMLPPPPLPRVSAGHAAVGTPRVGDFGVLGCPVPQRTERRALVGGRVGGRGRTCDRKCAPRTGCHPCGRVHPAEPTTGLWTDGATSDSPRGVTCHGPGTPVSRAPTQMGARGQRWRPSVKLRQRTLD